jgi:D-3-phosphoglycerate dehydrogenase
MKVYLSEGMDPQAYARLAAQAEIVTNFDHPQELDAIIIRRVLLTREILQKATRCKIVAMHGVGLDTIDMDAAKEFGIPVVNVPGGSAESVAELAVAFMLAMGRKLKQAERGLAQGRYKSFGPEELVGTEVLKKTVGLVGFGHISRRVGEIMRVAFGCRILVYNPSLTKEKAAAMEVEKVEELNDLFARCDYISISVPLKDSTRNMIDDEVFAHANPNLILVNTARGGIVDEGALYRALTQGKIAAAGFDVSVKEPMDKEDPLLDLENFMATPHIGASTVDAKRRVGNIVVDNIFKAWGIEGK